MIKLSGSLIGATGAARTEVATTKASAAKAINLIIRASHVFKKRFLDTWIVVDLAQQTLTQIKMARAGPNAFFGGIALFLTVRQACGPNRHGLSSAPESVGGTASMPTACCYKRWDLLTNRWRLRIQTTGYRPLPTVRAMLSMQGALSSVR